MEINTEFYNWLQSGYGHTTEGLFYERKSTKTGSLKWSTIRELFSIYNDEKLEKLIYETEQRVRWYVDGWGKHGLTPDMMFNLTTERLCELYNVDIKYFRP